MVLKPCNKYLFLLFLALPTHARDVDDQFAVFGVGAENCATYLVARDRGGDTLRWYHDWLAGYLSAVNTAAANTYDNCGDKSMADILSWLEGYCAVNPNMNFTNAVADRQFWRPARMAAGTSMSARAAQLHQMQLYHQSHS